MQFRPCIDIHDGKVKQIVGGSIGGESLKENFVASSGGDYYAKMYQKYGLSGGHAIILNKVGTPEYEASKEQARKALNAYPGGLMVGGGVQPDNAEGFIAEGASHVIVTSFVFHDGHVDYDRLNQMVEAVGKEHLCLDLSVRIKDNQYYIVTDRWTKFTEDILTPQLLKQLENYCSEYLIHAVDVEGKSSGIDERLVKLLADYRQEGMNEVTYAGGVHSYEDLKTLKEQGNNQIHVTIGSALDLFGGSLELTKVLELCQ
ncbi:MAG: phosphoribosylformimino-5-aminoimidazole carboxamide ribotide isomerase [Lachnospiraceae bacterium]|nr:phosphoribosylformimino-5-aminoimidazole carboxamide ribotide isomerase [Lachnospiraceae bacterium]